MDKNKNRTDLLAAGRKKLQQYRKKKDGKGSKSSSKPSKSEIESDANSTSADKGALASPQLSDRGSSSVTDSDAQNIASSIPSSEDNAQPTSNNDLVPSPVIPETDLVTTSLDHSVELLPDERSHTQNAISTIFISEGQTQTTSIDNNLSASVITETDLVASSSDHNIELLPEEQVLMISSVGNEKGPDSFVSQKIDCIHDPNDLSSLKDFVDASKSVSVEVQEGHDGADQGQFRKVKVLLCSKLSKTMRKRSKTVLVCLLVVKALE